MKTTFALLILAACSALAQSERYVRTNMQVAATITNGTTYTYAGTNFVDATRHSEVAFENRSHGDGSATNNVVWTFRLSLDGTNWLSSPTVSWVAGPGYTGTNFALGVYGYVQPYTRVSTNTTDLTNTLHGYLKGYRRD